MVATGCLWLLSALTTANNAWVFTLGFVFNSAAFGAFGHLLLAFPTGRLESRFHRLLVLVIWFDLIVLRSRCSSSEARTGPASDCRTAPSPFGRATRPHG